MLLKTLNELEIGKDLRFGKALSCGKYKLLNFSTNAMKTKQKQKNLFQKVE